MADGLAEIFVVFATPLGRGVLALSLLAMMAVLIVAFWGAVRMPRRDSASDDLLETAPPPLMAPKLASRSGEGGFAEDRPSLFRNALLLVIGFAFAVVLAVTLRVVSLESAAEKIAQSREATPLEQSVELVRVSLDQPEVQVEHGHPGSLCQPSGSLSDRFVEVCESGAAVRLDVMRFAFNDRFVLKPTWTSTAPTFVTSQSHAAPFGFADQVSFAAPETVSVAEYDAYLVIGVAAEGEDDAAEARARALRDFAIRQLSGGDRAQCLTQERVYTATATFDAESVDALRTQHAHVNAMERATQDGSTNEKARLASTKADLAQAEFLSTDGPAPLVIGITADPYASDPDADMKAAAEAFLASYGGALQLKDPSEVSSMRACARGEASL
ncbi:MAG: hypothetical protein AAF830_05715 [Pseudomonadota bacterium]